MKLIHRLLSSIAIGIVDGSAKCLKGKMMNRTLSEITSLTRSSGVNKGEMWIGGNGKIRFSGEIPKEIHQRLRNILASL